MGNCTSKRRNYALAMGNYALTKRNYMLAKGTASM